MVLADDLRDWSVRSLHLREVPPPEVYRGLCRAPRVNARWRALLASFNEDERCVRLAHAARSKGQRDHSEIEEMVRIRAELEELRASRGALEDQLVELRGCSERYARASNEDLSFQVRDLYVKHICENIADDVRRLRDCRKMLELGTLGELTSDLRRTFNELTWSQPDIPDDVLPQSTLHGVEEERSDIAHMLTLQHVRRFCTGSHGTLESPDVDKGFQEIRALEVRAQEVDQSLVFEEQSFWNRIREVRSSEVAWMEIVDEIPRSISRITDVIIHKLPIATTGAVELLDRAVVNAGEALLKAEQSESFSLESVIGDSLRGVVSSEITLARDPLIKVTSMAQKVREVIGTRKLIAAQRLNVNNFHQEWAEAHINIHSEWRTLRESESAELIGKLHTAHSKLVTSLEVTLPRTVRALSDSTNQPALIAWRALQQSNLRKRVNGALTKR